MTIMHTAERVALWLDPLGVPARMVWAGVRYRVSDTPTRLGPEPDALLDPVLTHPPRALSGWRFQGTADSGESLVFDVRTAGPAGWELIRVID